MIKGDEHVFFCPDPFGDHDGKKKLKLSVNLETDRFNCWSCGFKGPTLERLLRLERGNPDLVEYLDGVVADVEPEQQFEQPKLPSEFKLFVQTTSTALNQQYFAYARKRGLGTIDLYRYKIGFCDSGKYRGRIVVPSFDQAGELSTFSARSIYDEEPKYDAPSVDKNGLIFNELMVDWDRPIVIIEGVLDAIVGGDNCVPLCGKTLSRKSALFQKLIKRAADVYVCLDADAAEESYDICDDLMYYGLRPRLVLLQGKDPAEMGRRAFREQLLSAIDIHDKIGTLRARVGRMMVPAK